MIALPTTHNDRILFLDNIRYLMVLLVVVLHMACAYSHYTDWWAVNDDNSVVFDYLLRLPGIFLMPTLFFIAGYFALPSLRRWGTRRFIKGKIYRLGTPGSSASFWWGRCAYMFTSIPAIFRKSTCGNYLSSIQAVSPLRRGGDGFGFRTACPFSSPCNCIKDRYGL